MKIVVHLLVIYILLLAIATINWINQKTPHMFYLISKLST